MASQTSREEGDLRRQAKGVAVSDLGWMDPKIREKESWVAQGRTGIPILGKRVHKNGGLWLGDQLEEENPQLCKHQEMVVTDHKDEEEWNSKMQGRWGVSAVGQELDRGHPHEDWGS